MIYGRAAVRGGRRGDPGTVTVKFRFFNDTNEVSDAEAHASTDGFDYHPAGHTDNVLPHTQRTAPPDYLVPEHPHFGQVQITWNDEMLGPFQIGPTANDLDELFAKLQYEPANPSQLKVVLKAWDKSGTLYVAGPFG